MKICRIVKLLCAVCITSFLTGCVSPYIGKTRQEIVDIIAQEYIKAPEKNISMYLAVVNVCTR